LTAAALSSTACRAALTRSLKLSVVDFGVSPYCEAAELSVAPGNRDSG
jgi:hypothetical protein